MNTGEISDGYHTFNELYRHRSTLFFALQKAYPKWSWKSPLHDDGTMFEGMFIAGINTPEGQATYHCENELYAFCPAKVLSKAPPWDGHTSEDVLVRLLSL